MTKLNLISYDKESSLKVKTSFGNAPISKNEMEALITNHVKEYVLTTALQILLGNRLLIDIFGK